MNDAADLRNLRDVVEPAAPGLWPPAEGVWVVAVVGLCLLVIAVLRWRRARAASAYRRAGLALLDDAGTARDVNIVLKRVALAVFPREQVASLYGDDWAAFLDRTCGRTSFAALAVGDPAAAPSADLRRQATEWVRHHRTGEGAA